MELPIQFLFILIWTGFCFYLYINWVIHVQRKYRVQGSRAQYLYDSESEVEVEENDDPSDL